MNTNKPKLIIGIVILAISTLSCNLMTPKDAVSRVIPTLLPEDAQQLQDDLAQKVEDAMRGVPVTIELTETQLSSIINSKAAEQQNAQVSNVQVLLENNQMIITGNANANGISGPVNITLDVSTDGAGKPQLTISKAVMGNFPIPTSMLDPLTQAINLAMNGQAGEGFEINSLTIADHKLTISGQKK